MIFFIGDAGLKRQLHIHLQAVYELFTMLPIHSRVWTSAQRLKTYQILVDGRAKELAAFHKRPDNIAKDRRTSRFQQELTKLKSTDHDLSDLLKRCMTDPVSWNIDHFKTDCATRKKALTDLLDAHQNKLRNKCQRIATSCEHIEEPCRYMGFFGIADGPAPTATTKLAG